MSSVDVALTVPAERPSRPEHAGVGQQFMLIDGFDDLWRTAAAGVLTYIGLVLLLRLSGKRTLAALNAFDFVVTVALGSTAATILLSRDASVAEGLVALGVLIGAQYVVATLSVRWPVVRGVVQSRPVAVVVHGDYRTQAMSDERLTRSDIDQAVRRQGHGSVTGLAAVVLETDGSLSVISDGDDLSALDEVDGWPRAAP